MPLFWMATGTIGIGIIIRDDLGCCIVAVITSSSYCSSAEMGELLVVHGGLQLASDCGIRGLEVESDVGNAIARIRLGLWLAESGNIVHDILLLTSMVQVHKFVASSRRSNSIAHELAKAGRISGVFNVWLEDESPAWLHNLILADFHSHD
ncbi:conserved hypothetical protein [Ricinus communis]|uniref:RNase H type-1 domain-containing protein n=1 Tax=Ricinus communis TaxID=3988 RepID=B9SYA9_RICCO|nr:conserved hypothetical protein [Ricinus communis]